MGGVNDDSRIRRNPLGTPVVAMSGGGQLARMTHQSAVALGQTLRVLAADPLDPAAQVTPAHLARLYSQHEDELQASAAPVDDTPAAPVAPAVVYCR